MKCPKCQIPELAPFLIEEDLPALGCPQCRGSLVSLVYYRHWAETRKSEAESAAADPTTVQASDTATALACPKCRRLMTKYKVTGKIANRLDVCAECHEAWLDHGEWELLEALEMSHRIPSIFTDQWQRQIRHEMSEESHRSLLRRSIGDSAAARVEEFRAWLAEQKQRPEILTYLYRDLRH